MQLPACYNWAASPASAGTPHQPVEPSLSCSAAALPPRLFTGACAGTVPPCSRRARWPTAPCAASPLRPSSCACFECGTHPLGLLGERILSAPPMAESSPAGQCLQQPSCLPSIMYQAAEQAPAWHRAEPCAAVLFVHYVSCPLSCLARFLSPSLNVATMHSFL